MKKRLLSAFLALSMLFSIMPSAFSAQTVTDGALDGTNLISAISVKVGADGKLSDFTIKTGSAHFNPSQYIAYLITNYKYYWEDTDWTDANDFELLGENQGGYVAQLNAWTKGADTYSLPFWHFTTKEAVGSVVGTEVNFLNETIDEASKTVFTAASLEDVHNSSNSEFTDNVDIIPVKVVIGAGNPGYSEEYIFEAQFNVTLGVGGQLVVGEDNKISTLGVNIARPVPGGTPATSPTGFTETQVSMSSSNITWSDGSGTTPTKFVSGKQYTATFDVVSSGDDFDSSVTGSFLTTTYPTTYGATVAITPDSTDPKKATVVVTYPAIKLYLTAVAPNSSVTATYGANESITTSDISATVSYNNGASSGTVAYASFADNGISLAASGCTLTGTTVSSITDGAKINATIDSASYDSTGSQTMPAYTYSLGAATESSTTLSFAFPAPATSLSYPAVTSSNSNVTAQIQSGDWYKDDQGTTKATKFEYGNTYYAQVTLTPATNYKLADSDTFTITDYTNSGSYTSATKATSTPTTADYVANDGSTGYVLLGITMPTLSIAGNDVIDYYDAVNGNASVTITLTNANAAVSGVSINGVSLTKTTHWTESNGTITLTKAGLAAVYTAANAAGLPTASANAEKKAVTVTLADGGTVTGTSTDGYVAFYNTTPYVTFTATKGSAAISGGTSVSTSGSTKKYALVRGTSYTITHTPATTAHQTGTKWTETTAPSGGGTKGGTNDSTYTFTPDSSDKTKDLNVELSVAEVIADSYKLTVTNGSNGSVSVVLKGTTTSATSVSGGYTIWADEEYTVTAKANNTYYISQFDETPAGGTPKDHLAGTEPKTLSFDISNPDKAYTVEAAYTTREAPTAYIRNSATAKGATTTSYTFQKNLTTGDVKIDYDAKNYPTNPPEVSVSPNSGVAAGTASDGTFTLGHDAVNALNAGTYTYTLNFGEGKTTTVTLTVAGAKDISNVTFGTYTHGERFNSKSFSFKVGTQTYTWNGTTWSTDLGSLGTDVTVSTATSTGTAIDTNITLNAFIAKYFTPNAYMYRATNNSGVVGLQHGTKATFVYGASQDIATITVNQKTLNITGSWSGGTSTTKYNGTDTQLPDTVAVAFTTPSDVVSPDDVSVSLSGTPAFASNNASNSATVNYAAALGGDDKDNYKTGTYSTLTGVIQPRSIVITNINNVPSTTIGTPVSPKQVTGSVVTNSSTTTNADISSGDGFGTGDTSVGFNYSYEYTSAMVNGSDNTPKVNISSVASTNDNYTITYTGDSYGSVTLRGVSTIAWDTQPRKAYNYGKLLTTPAHNLTKDYELDLIGTKVKINYSGNGGSEVFEYLYDSANSRYYWKSTTTTSTLSASTITFKWTGGSAAAHGEILSPINLPTKSAAKTITLTYTADSDVNTLTTDTLSVAQAPLTVTATAGSGLEKVYDGTKDVTGSFTYALDTTGVVEGDTVSLVDSTGTGIAAEYTTVTSSSFGAEDVEWSGATVVNKPIKFTTKDEDNDGVKDALQGTHAANYTIADIPNNTTNGKITQRPITVGAVANMTHATQYNHNPGSQTGTLTDAYNGGTSNVVTFYDEGTTDDGIKNGDTVYVTLTYSYKNDDIDENPVRTGTTPYDVDITGWTYSASPVTHTDNGNYSMTDFTGASDGSDWKELGKGTVDGKTVQRITITAIGTKRDYQVNDALELNNTLVEVRYTSPTVTDSYIYSDPAKSSKGTTAGWYVGSDLDDIQSGASPVIPPFDIKWDGTNGTIANNGDTLASTDDGHGLYAVHKNGTTSFGSITINVGAILINTVKVTVANGAADKVYNNSDAVLDASKFTYTADDLPNGASITATPKYADKNVGTHNIIFTSASLSGADGYALAPNVQFVDATTGDTITGTIAKRQLLVTLDSGYKPSIGINSTNGIIAVDSTNYTITAKNPNEGTDTENEDFLDGIGVTVKALYDNTENAWSDKTPSINWHVDYEATLAKDTNHTIDITPKNTDDGIITGQTYTLIITTNKGAVSTVVNKDTSVTDPTTSVGTSLEHGEKYAARLTPTEPTKYIITDIKQISPATGGTFYIANSVASDNSYADAAFTMPGSNVELQAVLKQLPDWGAIKPAAIDKTETVGNYEFLYVGDYTPDKVVIDGLTITLTEGTNLDSSTGRIYIPKTALQSSSIEVGSGKEVKLNFPDAPGAPTVLTTTIDVTNNATVTKTITVDASPSQTTDATLKYGAQLSFAGMKFHTETAQTGEDTVYTYYQWNDTNHTWEKFETTDNDAAVVAAGPYTDISDITAENITLSWSDASKDDRTPEYNNTLFYTKDNGNAIRVTWSEATSPNYDDTDAFTVKQFPLTYSVTSTVSKVYDSTTDIGIYSEDSTNTDNKDKIVPTITSTGMPDGSNISVVVDTAVFADEHVKASETINVTYKLQGDNTDEYSATLTGTTTGEIKAKTVNITNVKIKPIPTGTTGAGLTQTVSGPLAGASGKDTMNDYLSEDGVISGDDLEFTVTGTYASNAAANQAFTLASSASSIGDNQYWGSVSGTDAGNYNFVWENSATGDITTKQLSRIEIVQQPKQTKPDAATTATNPATHGDTLDLTDLQVKLVYGDGSEEQYTWSKDPASAWVTAGLEVLLDNVYVDDTKVLRKDENNGDSLVVRKGTISTKTDSLVVNPRTLTVRAAISGADKDYDGTTDLPSTGVTKTATFEPALNTIATAATDGVDAADVEIEVVYPDVHKGNDKVLQSKDSSAKADLAWKTGTSSKITENYNLALVSDQADLTGTISARKIVVTNITIDPVFVRQTTDLTTDRTGSNTANITDSSVDPALTLSDTTGCYTTAGKDDVIKIAYKATYSSANVATDGKKDDIQFDQGFLPAASIDTTNGVLNDYDITLIDNSVGAEGEVLPKTLSDISVTKPEKDTYTHGEGLNLTGMRITLTYNNGAAGVEYYVYGTCDATDDTKTGWYQVSSSTATIPSDSTLSPVALPTGVTLVWSRGTQAVTPNDPMYFDDTRFTGTGEPKTGNITVSDGTITRAVEIKVQRKAATLTVTSDVEKVYDKTNKLYDAANPITLTGTQPAYEWGTDEIITRDTSDMAVDTTATLAKLFFDTVNTDAAKLVGASGDIKASDIVFATPAVANNYNITVVSTNAKGTITKKDLNVTDVKAPEVTVGDSATGTLAPLTYANGGYKTYNLLSGDDVAIEYKYTFTDGTDAAGTGKTITVTPDSFKISDDEHAPGMNYTLKGSAPSTGTVKNKVIDEIEIVSAPTKTEYTHGEDLSLAGAQIKIYYLNDGVEPQIFTYDPSATDADKKWKTDDATPVYLPNNVRVEWQAGTGGAWDGNITAASTFNDKAIQRYDDTNLSSQHTRTLQVKFKNDGARSVRREDLAQITVKQKTIDAVTVLGADYEKFYDAKTDADTAGHTVSVADTLKAYTDDNKTTRDIVGIKLTKVEYPGADANYNKDASALLTGKSDYSMNYTVAFDDTVTDNANSNYVLATGAALTVTAQHGASDTDPIVGKIKQLPVKFKAVPVRATLEQENASDDVEVEMQNIGIDRTVAQTNLDAIQVDKSAEAQADGFYDIPEEDKGKFLADYTVVYAAADLDPANGTTPNVSFKVGSPVVKGIDVNNYDIDWGQLKGKLTASAEEILGILTGYKAVFTHGDPLSFYDETTGNTFSFTVVYGGGKPSATYTCQADGSWTKVVDGVTTENASLSADGIWFEWNLDESEETNNAEVTAGAAIKLNEHLLVDDNNNENRVDKLLIKALSNDTAGFKMTGTNNITIKPRTIYAGVTAGDLDKTYDGSASLEDADIAALTFGFYSDNSFTTAFDGSAYGDYGLFEVDKTTVTGTYKTDDKSADSKDVKWDDPNSASRTEVAKPISIDLTSVTLTGVNAVNYKLDTTAIKGAGADDLTGKILAKPLTIKLDDDVKAEAIFETAADGADRTKTIASNDYTLDGLVENDKVTPKVTYTYPTKADQEGEDRPNLPLNVAKDTAGDNDDWNNYSISISPTQLTGTITGLSVNDGGLTITKQPENKYTHGDDLDLEGMTVNVKYNDGSNEDFVYVKIANTTLEGWAKKKDGGVYGQGDVLTGEDNPFTLSWYADDETTSATAPVYGRMTHADQDNTKIKVTSTQNPEASDFSDNITVDAIKVYLEITLDQNAEIIKIYDADASANVEYNGVNNLTKLVYTMYVADEDGNKTITRIPSSDAINPVEATNGFFADSDGKPSPDVVTMSGTTPASISMLSATPSEKRVILGVYDEAEGKLSETGLPSLGGTEAENYDLVKTAYELKGKILPREVSLSATTVEKVPADAAVNARIKVTGWTFNNPPGNSFYDRDMGETKNIDLNWYGTYDGTKVVVPNTASPTSLNGTTAADNYDYTFIGGDFEAVSEAATAVIIKSQPQFVKDKETSPIVHGQELGDTDWAGLEYEVTYGDGKSTYHKLGSDGNWITGEGTTADGKTVTFTEPKDGTTFTWSNTGESTTYGTDNSLPDTVALIKKADGDNAKNFLTIGVDDQSGKTEEVTAQKKPVKVKVTGDAVKKYDGTQTVNTKLAYSFTGLVNDNDKDNIDISVPIRYAGDANVEGTKENNYPKAVEIDPDGTVTFKSDFYTLSEDSDAIDISGVTGSITPRQLKLAIIAPPKTVNTSATADKTVTVAKATTTYDDTNGQYTLASGSDTLAEVNNVTEVVTIGYKATYTDISQKTDSGKAEVTITEGPTINGGYEKAATNYEIVSTTIVGTVNAAGGETTIISGGGGGGGSVNTLTVHYKNEDGTAGDDVSSIYAPLGTDPVDLMGVFKQKLKDQTILWTSSNEDVATVDENGHVTFVGVGTATITAQSKTTKSLKDTVQITISEAPAAPTLDPNDPNAGKASPTPRPVYEKTDSLITKEMLNPYIVGYDDYVFGPELPISREELATIFARLIANNLYMDQDYGTSFPDVPEKWSRPYIGYLEGFNVVTGYEDGTFRPENYITRAEMAVMMAKAEGYNLDGFVSAEETGFPDMDEGYSTWAATKAIKILTDMGIMQGYPDGTFRPGQPITRAETVATVNRVLADMEVADYEVLPSDVTDAHWAYNDIVFAMNHRILKDAAADPQRFIWSEQFDENMIVNTEKVEGETVQTGEETPAENEDTETKEDSDNPDAVAAETKEDNSSGDTAQTEN